MGRNSRTFRRRWSSILVIYIIYLGVLSYFGWSTYMEKGEYLFYFGTIGASLLVLALLWFVLRKRENMRLDMKRKRDAADRRIHRNDDII